VGAYTVENQRRKQFNTIKVYENITGFRRRLLGTTQIDYAISEDAYHKAVNAVIQARAEQRSALRKP